ncbi:uncharacterized protein B0H18DRAFT_1010825 [Fomitopsis serialis]|uniref:uncharacterized protein n=1 Tax=Fomitopsis serialis TaxID=139415 RepID=UPI0020089DA2|nr:uncharacterized protein B0H18DRAFT_1010825 [Neoantrodia serialis]KAH9924705.1 hypothetical protein B0H18DRAFT_1010825 [Neoantrodia serialis]
MRKAQPQSDIPPNGRIPPLLDGSSSPIQLLPEDLLHDIFYAIVSTCTYTTQEGDIVSGSVLLLSASHVCRHWRSLTLAYPRLWSVKLRGPKSVWDPSEDVVRMAQILAERADRIEAFHIGQFFKEEMAKVLAFYAGTPAPNLRRLMALSGSYVEIPALFAGDMPALRRLHTSRISMPWLPYRDLIELDIPSQVTPATEDILWTLRRSPSLELFSVSLCLRQRLRTNMDLGDLCPSLRAVQLFICVDDLYSIIFRSPTWSSASNGMGDDEADLSSTKNTLDCVTLPNLTSLAIHANRYFLRTDQWVDVLEHVDFRSDTSLFAALGRDGADGRLVCPRLAHLVIMRASFTEAHAGEAWDALIGALCDRLEKGASKLAKLEITTRDSAGLVSNGWLHSLDQLVEGIDIHTVKAR